MKYVNHQIKKLTILHLKFNNIMIIFCIASPWLTLVSFRFIGEFFCEIYTDYHLSLEIIN